MSRPPINPEKSVAGIAVDPQTLERVIPESKRSDGTVRKQIKIRPGFTPQEDVRRFRGTKQAQMDTNALPKGHIIGWAPPPQSTAASGSASKPMSKSAKKNAKRKEKREEKKNVPDNWDDDEDGDDNEGGGNVTSNTKSTTGDGKVNGGQSTKESTTDHTRDELGSVPAPEPNPTSIHTLTSEVEKLKVK